VTAAADLLGRGEETALACWAAIAGGVPAARVVRPAGAGIAVFPEGPERAVYNNAILTRDLPGPERAAALDAVESVYAAAGIGAFAAWTHESDPGMRAELERRGYRLAEITRAMGSELGEVASPEADLAPPDWEEYLRVLELPPGLLAGVDPAAFHVVIARCDGAAAATGMAFDHDGDAGIYNVGTLAHARRRGLGTAVTLQLLHDARARGCRTATLQATEVAERVYASAGFLDLGRILEYAPPWGEDQGDHWGDGAAAARR
jgi:ribosomal protein S18 acetylase RimI-like enzyme